VNHSENPLPGSRGSAGALLSRDFGPAVAFLLLFAGLALGADDHCSVTGRVVSAATGEPVRKVQVILRPADPRTARSVPLGAVTDASGGFSLPDLEPGQYRLFAERAGFVSGEYGARRPSRSGTPITLLPGQDLTGVEVRLTPQGVITGRVQDEDGDAVANAMVQVLRYTYAQGKRQLTPGMSAATNDLGEYRLYGISPGRYYVAATARGALWSGLYRSPASAQEEIYAPTFYPSTADAASAVPLDVAAGAQLQGIDLTLARVRTVTISGKVVNAAGGAAPSNPMVFLVPQQSAFQPGRYSTSVQDPQGRFVLRGVPPGRYVAAVESWSGGQRFMARQPLEVGNADVEGVTLTILPGVNVAGRLRIDGPGHIDLTKVRVFLHPESVGLLNMGTPSAQVQEDGSFLLSNVGPDEYSVGVAGAPDDCYLKSVKANQQEIVDGAVDLSTGAGVNLQVTLSSAGGGIDGVVLSGTQQAAGARVVLVPEKSRRARTDLYKTATTDQRGNFVLRGIAPGDYQLYAWEDVDEGAWYDPDFLARFDHQAQSVAIEETSREGLQLQVIAAN